MEEDLVSQHTRASSLCHCFMHWNFCKLSATAIIDAAYLGTDPSAPLSVMLVDGFTSPKCIKFYYIMPVGLYIYVGGMKPEAFNLYTFNPIMAGGTVITNTTVNNQWNYG